MLVIDNRDLLTLPVGVIYTPMSTEHNGELRCKVGVSSAGLVPTYKTFNPFPHATNAAANWRLSFRPPYLNLDYAERHNKSLLLEQEDLQHLGEKLLELADTYSTTTIAECV